MWEAIRSNQRKSVMLIWVLGFVLAILGYLIAEAFGPGSGLFGLVIALAIWIIMLLSALYSGKQILITTTGAIPIKKEDYPVLFNVVEEMSIASGLVIPPKIYLMESDSPNAFAMGLDPKEAAIAVTSGLLRRLNRDELQGVIAHEMGHVRNLDIKFMTIASVTVGAIVLIADMFLRGMRYMSFSGGGRKSRSSDGQGQLIILLLALAAAILAPLAAQILYFACSRKREYLADASSARFTRYPEGLASALEKISGAPKMTSGVNRAVAPLFIVNPLKGMEAASLFATHPPIDKRIRILRFMGGNAGFAAYESSYKSILKSRDHIIGASSLVGAEAVPVREANPEAVGGAFPGDTLSNRSSQVAAMLDKIGGFNIITCVCDVKIKIPPGYDKETITCPRCGLTYPVPQNS